MTPEDTAARILAMAGPYNETLSRATHAINLAIAAAVAAEREANCAAMCAHCAGKYPDYGKAEFISGRWEHRITESGICYRVYTCDAAAIRARGNGSAGA